MSKSKAVAKRDSNLPALREDYYHVLLQVCPPERFADIVETAVRKAIDGDWRARQWITNYVLGPPIQVQEIMVQSKTEMMVQVVWDEEPVRAVKGPEAEFIEGEIVYADSHSEAETAT